jgi:predicted HTH domain antitoxin
VKKKLIQKPFTMFQALLLERKVRINFLYNYPDQVTEAMKICTVRENK